jgi:hypothetical protein
MVLLRVFWFLFGSLLGAGIFSGQFAVWTGTEPVWIWNPQLPMERYYFNVIIMSIVLGFSALGGYLVLLPDPPPKILRVPMTVKKSSKDNSPFVSPSE